MAEREWPELRDSLMNLLSAVITSPEKALDSFAGWCTAHRDEMEPGVDDARATTRPGRV